MRKHLSILLLLVSFFHFVNAQKVNWKKINEAMPDKVLLEGERKPTKVLLLGTFHFDYPNMDQHKTDSSKHVDVLSVQRQKELDELMSVIARYKPTKIYIESKRKSYHDSLYAQYLAGKYKLERNEIYQICYRAGKENGVKKLAAVDATNFAEDRYNDLPVIDSMWSNNDATDSLRDKYWARKYSKVYQNADSIFTKFSMLESFLYMSEPGMYKKSQGSYFSNGFNKPGNDGADILAVWWYDRNFRIFNNILNTKPAPEDRIMIVFGVGHMSILNHCFESSPEFEVVSLKSLLNK